MSYTAFQKGLEGRKWDLHIHSSLSILNNQFPKLEKGKPDSEIFLQKIETLDMEEVGITCYFTIEFAYINAMIEIYKILQKINLKNNWKNFYDFIMQAL